MVAERLSLDTSSGLATRRDETRPTDVGRGLYAMEHAFSCVWSVAEVAVACARRRELKNPHAQALGDDVRARGFYVDVEDRPAMRERQRPWPEPRMVVGESAYRFVSEVLEGPSTKKRRRHRVLARLQPAQHTRRARKLLVVLHCYGVPWPGAMERFFGIDRLADTDVAYAIMNHHQRGSYPLWPGTGFTSANPACMLENLRAAVSGARTLIRGLRHARGYDHVSVLGYSIGGQLAMHVANTEPIERLLLYCPVVSVERVSRELGLMRNTHPWLMKAARAIDPSYRPELLSAGDPLQYPLKIAEDRVSVFAQRYDAMTPIAHVRTIRDKYPDVRWHEFDGTHVVPFGRAQVRAIVRDELS